MAIEPRMLTETGKLKRAARRSQTTLHGPNAENPVYKQTQQRQRVAAVISRFPPESETGQPAAPAHMAGSCAGTFWQHLGPARYRQSSSLLLRARRAFGYQPSGWQATVLGTSSIMLQR